MTELIYILSALLLILSALVAFSYYYYLSLPVEQLKQQIQYTSIRSIIPRRSGVKSSAYQDVTSFPGFLTLLLLLHEDDLFFEHTGANWREVFNRLRASLFNKTRLAGGSSITLQLAKLIYTGQGRSLIKKLKQLVAAIKIEQTLSKDEILGCYLGAISFGYKAHGIHCGAKYLFNKNTEQLSIPELLIILAFIPSPMLLEYNLVYLRNDYVFNYLTSFDKIREALRILAANQMDCTIFALEKINYNQVVRLMSCYSSTNTRALGEQKEQQISIISADIVYQVKNAIENINRTTDYDSSLYAMFMLEEQILINATADCFLEKTWPIDFYNLHKVDWQHIQRLTENNKCAHIVNSWLRKQGIDYILLQDTYNMPDFESYADLTGLLKQLENMKTAQLPTLIEIACVAKFLNVLDAYSLDQALQGKTKFQLAIIRSACRLFPITRRDQIKEKLSDKSVIKIQGDVLHSLFIKNC